MPTPARILPSEDTEELLASQGFRRRHDDDLSYARYHRDRDGVGIVFAVHLPFPWGLYWRSPVQVIEVVWTRELPVILDLADKIS